MNYKEYLLSAREKLKCAGMAAGFAVLLSWLFYDSFWGLLLWPMLFYILQKRMQKQQCLHRQQLLAMEFLDTLKAVSSALVAGFSMENAWIEVQKEIGMLHGEESMMYQELRAMNRAVKVNVPLEDSLADFADRSGNEDIHDFTEVFRFAKRSGSNMVRIIEDTVYRIRSKRENLQEIEVLVASKKMEQRIMNVVPCFLILYLKVTNREYLSVIYGNAGGVLFMSICLIAYGITMLLAEKILDIQV